MSTAAPEETLSNLGKDLAVGHLLRHVEKKSTIAFFNSTQEPAKTPKIARFLTLAAPRNIVSAFALRKIGKLWRFFAVIEKLVERNFHRSRQFFEGFDRRNGMTVFDAGDVAPKQSGALFNITLGKFFCFSEQTYTVTYNHMSIVSRNPSLPQAEIWQ